jgi:hypothetical protein
LESLSLAMLSPERETDGRLTRVFRTLGVDRTSTKYDRLVQQLAVLEMENLSEHELDLIDQAGATQHYRHFVRSLSCLAQL